MLPPAPLDDTTAEEGRLGGVEAWVREESSQPLGGEACEGVGADLREAGGQEAAHRVSGVWIGVSGSGAAREHGGERAAGGA